MLPHTEWRGRCVIRSDSSVSWWLVNMKLRIVSFVIVALLAPLAAQTRPDNRLGGQFENRGAKRMPDGRDRTLAILKKDAEKSTEDMAKVVELAQELREDVEKNQYHTVDLGSVRKADEIIKLMKRVKSRLVRHQ